MAVERSEGAAVAEEARVATAERAEVAVRVGAPAAAEGQAARPVERERLVAADPAVPPGTAPVVRVRSIARGSPSTATAAPFRLD